MICTLRTSAKLDIGAVQKLKARSITLIHVNPSIPKDQNHQIHDFSLLNETVCKNIHNHMKVEASNILDTKVFGIYSEKHKSYVSPDVYFFAMDYNDLSERYTEIG